MRLCHFQLFLKTPLVVQSTLKIEIKSFLADWIEMIIAQSYSIIVAQVVFCDIYTNKNGKANLWRFLVS